MRSPIIAFSIVAAAAVSPTLVAGAPTSPNLPTPNNLPGNGIPNLPQAPNLPHAPVRTPVRRRELESRKEHHSKTHVHQHYARQSDGQTAGGNAYSGSSSNVNGGNVFNVADTPDGVITNDPGSNTAGTGGDTFTGDAVGGNGGGFGPGGNAYTGFAGNSNGGDIDNVGTSNIENVAISNTAGDAGTTTSGDAIGGDESDFDFENSDFGKRDIDNDGGLAGAGGFSTSGLAAGGRGGDNGQGGNAYSGSVGTANGGDVNNGEIDVDEFQPPRGSGGNGGNGGGFGTGNVAGAGVPGAAAPPPPPAPNAPPQRFGGGNAFSGNTGNDRGGNFNNVAEDDQDISNIPGGTAGVGGQSFSGDAIGGDAA